MNSQFKNSSVGFIIYMGLIAVIALASIFIFWYMGWGYKLGTYEEDTILGSVYLGGLREDEVELTVNRRINRWLDDDSIVFEVTYQGYSYEIDRELFYFDIDTSMFFLDPGITNELVVTFQGDDRATTIALIQSQPFLRDIKDNIDYEKLMEDIQSDVALMKSFSSKDLELYISDYTEIEEVIHSTTITSSENININEVLSKVTSNYDDGRIVLPSKELYDVVRDLGEDFSNVELSILASEMLYLLWETNFSINELHYKSLIDYNEYDINTYPYIGHNVYIDKIVDNSFSFYNPNELDYYFYFEKVSDTELELSLVGVPFVNDIRVNTGEMITIVEKTIKTTTNLNDVRTGHDGAFVTVIRTTTDVNGDVVEEQQIVFEYYPPLSDVIFAAE